MVHTTIGKWGEEKAAEYLRKQRYQIIGANYRTRFGEIDLIAVKKEYVVFVEVKLRKDDAHGQAREFVMLTKQKKLLATAQIWLAQNPTKLQPRFDVIEIYAPNGIGKTFTLKHVENAFQC